MDNFSAKMYGIYLQEMRGLVAASGAIDVSFLAWHRTREYNPQTSMYVFRGGQENQTTKKTLVVACRYWYELTDGFWGQMVLTQIPHLHAVDILPKESSAKTGVVKLRAIEKDVKLLKDSFDDFKEKQLI